MATAIHNDRMIEVSSSSDDEYYYEYEMVEDSTAGEDKLQTTTPNFDNKRVPSTVSVETVQDDDDDNYDEYTYEEETILEVVMEQPMMEDETDSAAEPPPLPKPRNDGYGSKPPPPSSKPPPPPAAPLPVATPIPSYVPSSPKEVSPITKRSSYKQSSFLQQQAPPDLQSPSQQRAKNSAGLSELSKQLRILQAKNEAQNVEINRLERQLRILADLQGISVGDLRKALEDACASEAFGELQNRVAKLKYELEAATLLKQDKLRKDAAAPYIANLELKVGELEEVEEKQQLEIRNLYESLRQEKARATQYQSENQKLKAALQDMIQTVQADRLRFQKAEEDFQKQLQELRERQSKMMQEQANMAASSGSNKQSQKGGTANSVAAVSPEMAKEYEQMVQLLKKKDEELRIANAKLHADEIRKAEKLKEAEERWCEEQMKMQVEKDKMALTVKELEDADGQNGLRLAQFKARFTVQNERLVDMGQQLDSLYTAFDMYKEEFDSERSRNEAMQNNLTDADAAVARQKMEEGKSKSSPGFPPSSPRSSYATPSSPSSTKTPRHARKPAIATRAPVSPMTPVTARSSPTPYYTSNTSSSMTPYNSRDGGAAYSNYSVDFNDTPTTYATARPYNPTPEKTPSTWDILKNRDTHTNYSSNNKNNWFALSLDNPDGQLICGSLIVESKSMLRKWKTRPSRIYLRGEGYQWDIGEKRSFPLEFGISKVEFDPNYPLSFAVSLNPGSPNAPTIRAATANEYEYHRWMAALYKATTGEEYQGGVAEKSNVVAAAKSHRFDDLERTPDPWAAANSKSHRFNDLERTPDPWADANSKSHRFNDLERTPDPWKNANSKSHRFNDLEKSPDPWSTVPSASRVEEQSDAEDADLQRILELSKYET